MSKYVVFSGSTTGKYGPEIIPYLDTVSATFKGLWVVPFSVRTTSPLVWFDLHESLMHF